MPGPLTTDLRVLDLSERSPAAAIAGMVLADLGAEVIRVEPAGGDPIRALAGSRVWLRGQRSLTIDAAAVQSGAWQALRDSADVIIDTAQPWILKPTGLLDSADRPAAQIHAILTAYPRTIDEIAPAGSGDNAPVCGELVEAQYGMQNFQQGVRPDGPHFLGWPHAIYGAAWMLQIGILGALYERAHTGVGQVVTTSLLDGAAILSNVRWLGGAKMGPSLLTGSRISTRPSNLRLIVGLFECADGYWIQVHTGPRGAFDRMLKVVGREDLIVANAGIHILATPLEPSVAQDLWAYLDRFFKTQPSTHWCDLLAQADVCCMPALKPGEALWLEQMERNGLVDIAPDGQRMLGRLAKYSRTVIAPQRATPAPGQDNALLAAQHRKPPIGAAAGNGAAVAPGDRNRVGPLDGILVLDFGAYMAGPFANRLFADLGARVIKVEEYGGDPMRGPQLSSFLGVQRGKESIAVDLKSVEGKQIALDLVRRADVVHHNLRAGAMERLGVGWDQLHAINPRLIFCHSSGYGNDGPWSKLPTFEPLHSALTGMLVRTGGDGNMPDHYLTHMDYGCGLTSCTMVLAALVEREQSGVGQYLEVPQTGA
ncbi:MAG TPA: CoA transferase, partial [Candidatus Binataceae bacterium]|nr:CoA transferase [Candidatus Binataceae bacterium]